MALVVIDPAELATLIEDAVTRALDRRAAPDAGAWLDVRTVAALLGVHRDTASRMARFNEIPSYRVGRSYRFKRDEIEAWIAKNR